MTTVTPAPLGASTNTTTTTVSGLAEIEQKGDDGGPYLVAYNWRGDVTNILNVGDDGGPEDRARVWESFAQAAQHAAEEAREQAVRAGGDYE